MYYDNYYQSIYQETSVYKIKITIFQIPFKESFAIFYPLKIGLKYKHNSKRV